MLEVRLADAFTGARIVVADSAARGLETASQLQPTAVVLDLGLRDMDGFEFARRLHGVTAPARTVVLTGDARRETRERACREGFAAFLVKPEGVDDLISVLRTLLG